MRVLNWLRERIEAAGRRRSAEEPAATRPLWVPTPDEDDSNGEDAGSDGGYGGDFGAGDGGGGGGDGGGAG